MINEVIKYIITNATLKSYTVDFCGIYPKCLWSNSLESWTFIGLEDWDIVRPVDVSPKNALLDKGTILGQITGSITNQVGRTVSQAAKVMGEYSNRIFCEKNYILIFLLWLYWKHVK